MEIFRWDDKVFSSPPELVAQSAILDFFVSGILKPKDVSLVFLALLVGNLIFKRIISP